MRSRKFLFQARSFGIRRIVTEAPQEQAAKVARRHFITRQRRRREAAEEMGTGKDILRVKPTQ